MISIKTKKEVETMRQGGRVLAEILEKLLGQVKPGVMTKDLDRAARALILDSGAKIAFQGFDGFPGAVCTSVNEEVVHSVPSARILQDGDIITLDIGLIWKGLYLDMARTVPVGQINEKKARLLEVTKKALDIGMLQAKTGNKVGDIGHAVQEFVEGNGYNVVRELCGHGIGRELHEDPRIPNFGEKGPGPELVAGMVICIEPMVTVGDWKLKRAKDGHGFETKDGSLSCHFEDTIAITSTGPHVLTRIK